MEEFGVGDRSPSGELIKWSGKPYYNAAKIRSMECALWSYLRMVFSLIGFFIIYHVVLILINEPGFPEADLKTVATGAIILLMIQAFLMYKKLKALPYTRYCLTDGALYLVIKNSITRVVKLDNIREVKVVASARDQDHDVSTIKLALKNDMGSEDDQVVYLESVARGSDLIALLKQENS